jgi:acetolactate synthase-1/2/3 large subunit
LPDSIGARFSDRVVSKVEAFAPNARIIHIDIDPAEISKNVTAHIPIYGDVKELLSGLTDRVAERDEE